MEDLTSLIYQNEKLIYSIINRYSYYFDKEDLYQVAVIGLINAYKNYKNDKNTKFSSYAYFYIKGEVKKYLRESNYFKVSNNIIKLNESIEKAANILCQKYNKEPTEEDLALFLEIDVKKIYEAKEAKYFIQSLDDNDEENDNLYNEIFILDNSYDSDILDLKCELENLPDIDKKIINERYINEKSQTETSKILNMTQVMVSRKEKEILTRLKTKLM